MTPTRKLASPLLPPPSGQPPHVLAAWLDDLITDICDEHVKRVAKLRPMLEQGLRDWDCAATAQVCKRILVTMNALPLDLPPPPSLLQKMLGTRATDTLHDFDERFEALCKDMVSTRREHADLAVQWNSQLSELRKAVVELDLEQAAMATDVEQGVGWLYELRQRLRKDARLEADYARDLQLVADYAHQRLKFLLELNTTLTEVTACMNAVMACRGKWIEALATVFQADSQWRECVRLMDADPADIRAADAELAVDANRHMVEQLAAADAAADRVMEQEFQLGRLLAAMESAVGTSGGTAGTTTPAV